MYGRTFARTFSTDCPSPITRTTAATLVPAWFHKTAKTVTASPAVVGGVVYVGDWSGTMYALDARSGAVRWTFRTAAAPGATYGPIVSSAAVTDVRVGARLRRLVIFGAGPRVYAVDAGGKLAWVRYVGATGPRGRPLLKEDPAEVESSPVVWHDTVYVGMDTHDLPDRDTRGVRGGLLALDARTGRVRWKFEPDRGFGCGGVWSSPALDSSRGIVYIGTANCENSTRSVWTPFVEALTALDADNGKPLWSFRPHEPNRKDWDFGATPNLAADAHGRWLVGAGNKDGSYYALNPRTGRKLWSTKVAEPGDVSEDFAVGGFIGSAAVWQGRIFGATAIGGPPYFHAIDADTGDVAWRGIQAPAYGAPAVVNGVVFHAALDNVFRAMDADTGRLVWSAPLAGPSSSGPAVVGDTVYVGSGTSSSDACEKDAPGGDACAAFFDEALGRTGGVHAFRLAAPQAATGPRLRLLNGQGNQLDAYDLSRDPPTSSVFIPNADHGGRDINAQICQFEKHYVLVGEDTGQLKAPPGWGIFDLRTRHEVGKLVADYATVRQPEQYGCHVETRKGRTSRIFVTQVGSGDFQNADGQLIVFFGSSPGFDAVAGRRTADEVCHRGDCPPLTKRDAHFCVIDPHLRTAGGMAVDAKGRLYVAEFAPAVPPEAPAPGRVLRYSPPFPTSAGRCFQRKPEVFIRDPHTATPGAIVAARDASGKPTGHWYVSSVIFPPAVNEYDASGAFVRNVLPPGFATPFGLAVDSRGTLYVADLGVDFDPRRISENPDRFGIDTSDGEGSVLRVRFVNGLPQPPEYLKTGLDYPDGLGIVSQ
jgi:polyvinyl alcohol dehydrogenase (cytochrome)